MEKVYNSQTKKTEDLILKYRAYGGALELWNYRGQEVLLHGPADTGKTRACLQKVDALCRRYPNTSVLLVRRHRKDMRDTTVRTLIDKVYGGDEERVNVRKVGGVNPQEFHYNENGSVIYLRGIDSGSALLPLSIPRK